MRREATQSPQKAKGKAKHEKKSVCLLEHFSQPIGTNAPQNKSASDKT